MVQLLLDAGASVNAQDDTHWTPPHQAAFWGDTSIMELLLDAGASVDAQATNCWTPLHIAVVLNCIKIANLLLERGASVNAKDGKGCTPLHVAAGSGYIDLSKLLLERGASVVAKDHHGESPLHYAASSKIEIGKLLLYYATVHHKKSELLAARNDYGRTAATFGGNAEFYALLTDPEKQREAIDEIHRDILKAKRAKVMERYKARGLTLELYLRERAL